MLRTYSTCSYPGYQDTTTYAALLRETQIQVHLFCLQVDNRGNRLIVTDDSDINTPAVAAAYAIKRYSKQAQDEISFEVRKCLVGRI